MTVKESYRIVLADDHVLLRQGLRKLLDGVADYEVIAESGDGLELLRLLRTITPHLVILDISMPNLRGIEAIHEIKALQPDARILILTMHKEKEYLSQALSSGAQGYLLKEDADTEFFSAIDKIRNGKIYVSPHFAELLAEGWAQVSRGNFSSPVSPEPLTTREREILKMIAEGKSSKEIAAVLFISPRTVERHRANLMEKLNIKKATDLVRYAIQNGQL